MLIEELTARISQLTESVRNHINTHRYQVVLLKDWANWNQICSSLDAVGDSLEAIKSYHKKEFPDDLGLKYLYTYGVLQALFLLQDAVRHLSEAFTITYKPSQVLLDIRNMRNAAIGHPTKQDQKGQRYYNYISRFSINKNGFELLRHSHSNQYDTMQIDLTLATNDQLRAITESFQQIVSKLEEVDFMHREKYQDNPLENIFHSAMGYFFEKIGQGISSHSFGNREFGHTHVRLVRETYEKFKSALEKRNEFSRYTKFDLDEYFHALSKLDGYLSGVNNVMEEADARIYLTYLRNEHNNFVQIAKGIDEEYRAKA